MFVVIVENHCHKEMLEKATREIDENGILMKRLDRVLFRHRLVADDDLLLVTTITAWASPAPCAAWMKVKPVSASGEVSTFYESVKNGSHQVKQSHRLDRMESLAKWTPGAPSARVAKTVRDKCLREVVQHRGQIAGTASSHGF